VERKLNGIELNSAGLPKRTLEGENCTGGGGFTRVDLGKGGVETCMRYFDIIGNSNAPVINVNGFFVRNIFYLFFGIQ
jgi:hypothetical protein